MPCIIWKCIYGFLASKLFYILRTAQVSSLNDPPPPPAPKFKVQCCLTPTETTRLMGQTGRPPRLPHSSWALPKPALRLLLTGMALLIWQRTTWSKHLWSPQFLIQKQWAIHNQMFGNFPQKHSPSFVSISILLNPKQISGLISSPSHFSFLFNCWLSVVLQLDKGDHPQN